MIQTQTILKVADNSGAKSVKCIKVLGKSTYASVGDCILVSVKSVRTAGLRPGAKGETFSTIQKGQIFKALVLRTKKNIARRPYGHVVSFQNNNVVLLGSQGQLLGSRIFGPITRELLLRKSIPSSSKVISQSKRML